MNRPLDSKLLKEFLKMAGSKLEGNWLLVGGTLLPAVGLQVRTTVDIDFVGLGKKESAQSLELMELAESLGLSVETINQAAKYFVEKVGYEKEDLIPLVSGKKATIFRPSISLYWKLKVGRLSETDLIDCQHYLGYCRGQNDKIDEGNLLKILNNAEKITSSSQEQSKEFQARLNLLRKVL